MSTLKAAEFLIPIHVLSQVRRRYTRAHLRQSLFKVTQSDGTNLKTQKETTQCPSKAADPLFPISATYVFRANISNGVYGDASHWAHGSLATQVGDVGPGVALGLARHGGQLRFAETVPLLAEQKGDDLATRGRARQRDVEPFDKAPAGSFVDLVWSEGGAEDRRFKVRLEEGGLIGHIKKQRF